MDSGKQLSSGVTFVAHGDPSNYQIISKTENPEPVMPPMVSPPMAMSGSSERKKRGRPRKYKPEEYASGAYPGMHVSSSAPPDVAKSSEGERNPSVARPANSEKKQKTKIGEENLDDSIECSTGSSFLPHVITVNAGEDISTKIMEFSLQGPRAVCVISASGTVSNVTIRHPNSSGGTLTYEGLFEIISFSGSFTSVEMPDSRFGRSGMLTITLTGADGRVVGGLIAGLTVAASPVKVVVASFLLGNSHEARPKKQKIQPAFPVNASNGAPLANMERMISNAPHNPSIPSMSHNPNNWAATQPAERSMEPTADINISLEG